MAQQAGTTPRQTAGEPAARLPRWTLRTIIAATALGVTLAACSNSSDPLGNVAARAATGDAVRIQAVDGDRFTPATLELPAGEEVTIEITNTDDRAHDLAVEAADLNTGTIETGGVATATFTVPEGATQFVCTFHSGMTGTIEGVDQE